MATGDKLGNTLLNNDLAKLVSSGQVEFEEAMSKTPDKPDLARKCGRPIENE